MPHSLRAKLKYLTICGHIRKKDYERLCKALDNEGVLDKIKAEIETDLSHFCFDDWGNENPTWKEVKAIIDKYKADKKDCTTCIGFGDKDYAQSFCHDCIKDIQNHYKADKE